jgi:hypothetical protein
MGEPTRKARDQLGREPTQTTDTFCRYCQTEYMVVQALKYHVLMDHVGQPRYFMYLQEGEELRFLREQGQ